MKLYIQTKVNKIHMNFFVTLLIITSVLLMLFFAFFGTGKSLWLDQAYSVFVARQNLQGIISNLKMDNTPPLYYILLAFWIRLFGIGEFSVRSLSGVIYIISVVMVYILGKSLYNDRKTGLLCAFLYMISPLTIRHAQNARMYSLLGLMGILSTLFFLRIFLLKTEKKRDIVFYVIVNILGTITHYWFFFILLSHIFSILFMFSKSTIKKFTLTFLASVMPFFIFWFPVFLFQIQNDSTSWIEKIGILLGVFQTFLDFFGKKFALLVYFVFFMLVLIKRITPKIEFNNFQNLKNFVFQKKNGVLFVSLFTLLFVPLIISQIEPIYSVGRYTILTILPFIVITGALLSRYANNAYVLLCCYILLGGVFTGFVRAKTKPEIYSDRLTTKYLIKNAHKNDVFIFTSLSRVTIDYYLLMMNEEKSFVEVSYPSEISIHLGWRNVNKMLNKKQLLEKEAENISDYTVDLCNENTKIWLFDGSDNEVNEILKVKLNFKLKKIKRINLKGSFFNSIIIYQKKCRLCPSTENE